MAEAKRDRSIVSTAWLAHWAIEGDEDPAFVQEYAHEGFGALMRITAPLSLSREDQAALADLKLFLLSLRNALDPQGSSRMQLRLEHRKITAQGGRRRLTYDEILRRRQAGAKAYRYKTVERLSKGAAIERARQDMIAAGLADGLSDRIIEREYDRHRRELKALTSAKNPT